MSTRIYITSAEGHSGKSAIGLGVLDLLSRQAQRIGVFRPVTRSRDERDHVVELLLAHDAVDERYEQAIGVTYDDVHDDPEGALATIIARGRELEAEVDALVIVGSDYTDVGSPTELAFNARVAANLGAPMLLVLTGISPETGEPRSADDLRGIAELTLQELGVAHARVTGVIANRVRDDAREAIIDAIGEVIAHSDSPVVAGHEVPVWAIPDSPLLSAPTVGEVLHALGGELYAGDEALLGREVLGTVVAGMAMENVLRRMIEGGIMVIPADRSETLIAVLTANAAPTFPTISGIVVNGDFELSDVTVRLLEGLAPSLPMLRTPLGTFDTARAIVQTRGRLTADSRRKIDTARALFERYVSSSMPESIAAGAPTDIVTPLMFEYGLLDRAKHDRKRIVLPEGDDDRILQAASTLLTRGVADLTILGDETRVRARAAELGLSLDGADVLSPEEGELHERFASEYAELRRHKGMTIERAREIVSDVSYFGTMMVHEGLADGMVSGAAHTTAHTIKPSFEIIKTKPGTSIVSSVFLMALADRVLVYGDCAVNPNPTAEQLADIAISSAETAAQFGIEPRVAMLSYSTGDSGAGADVDRVREATRLVRERRPELLVEGPIQYDAAADAAVAGKKLPGSQVAGRATVFIFPDLNTGNNTYKAVQRSAGAIAIGPVLQGLNRPINDLSRGALVSDIVNTVAITCIQAQGGAA